MNLSLWQIESELANLIDLRDQLAEAGEDVGPCEQAIREYCQREIKKVDGLRAYIRNAEMMVSAAKNEAKLQNDRANAWQARIDRLKEFCRLTMEAWGAKRLDGATGSLMLKGNGGKQAVTITDASLVPKEYVQYTGTISGAAWWALRELFAVTTGHGDIELFLRWSGRQDVQMERIPHKGRIGAALDAPCSDCRGTGYTGGDRHFVCSSCEADGKARVPGARLEPRGNHVSIL